MDQIEDKNIESLSSQLRSYKAVPSNGTWSQLDNRLEHLRSKKRIRKFRNVSIAASLLAIVSVVSVMSLYLGNHNPDLFATSHVFQPVLMEPISDSDDEFYDLKSVEYIYDAYATHLQELN